MTTAPIFDDSPVLDIANNHLWPEEETILAEIERIAETILQPLVVPDKQYRSMTFAVHGKWGMGKSTALNFIRDKALELARSEGLEKRLIFPVIHAPFYESFMELHGIEVQHLLALSILNALSEIRVAQPIEGHAIDSKDSAPTANPAEALELFQDYVPGAVLQKSTSSDLDEGSMLERLIRELQARMDLDQIVSNVLSGKRLKPPFEPSRVCALFVDDLDRCDPDFTRKLLMTLQRWSTVRNLYFVVAVDIERLRKAVKAWKDNPENPDFALEKYIQHSISVPEFDEQRMAEFLKGLISDHPNLQEAMSSEGVARLFLYGLREQTPRSVKRSMNGMIPRINKAYQDGKRGDDLRLAIKEALLHYSWPDFHRQHFYPASRQWELSALQASKLLAFISIQKRADEFVRGVDGRLNDVDRLEFMLKRDSRSIDVELDQIVATGGQNAIDLQLIRFLGTPPLWFQAKQEAPQEPIEPKGINRKLARELEERFQQLYFDGEAAEKEGVAQTSLDRARDILDLIRSNREYFNNTHAPSVGNVAINAERFQDYELADDLYRLALELDQEHSNNLQNYADFIVKKQIDQRYDVAAQIIAKLKTGKHAGWKPERTAELEVLLAAQSGGQAPTQGLEMVLQSFFSNPADTRRFVSTMSLLQDINQFARAREVGRLYYDAVSAPYMKYVGIRALADVLASSNDSNDELSAMELYRCMLARQCYPESDISEIKQNYAVLLYKYDINDEAGQIWYDAYVRAPDKPNIRRSYSLYLLRGGRPDLAKLVNEGQPLPPDEPPFLQPKDKPMPDAFTADPCLGFDDMPTGPLVADLQP